MDFVTDYLAIGDLAEATAVATLKAHRIESVLSLEPVAIDTRAFVHQVVSFPDRKPIARDRLKAVLAFLDEQLEANRRVFMHCKMGISRSPAMAAAHLTWRGVGSLSHALAQVRWARAIAEPHPTLMESIKRHLESAGAEAAFG